MGLQKNVVYRFVDDPRSDELEVDRTGKRAFRNGDILPRGERLWRVCSVQWELSDENSKRVPTLWVYLTKARGN